MHPTFGNNRWLRLYKQKRWFRGSFHLILLFVLFLIFVPAPKFQSAYSTVLFSRDSVLLNARVASDEQWRFAEQKELPKKYVQALLMYEDQYFYYHPGVDPVSLTKAAWRDIRAGKVVSGGSTITMQLARISRHNPPRTFLEKFWEILIALKAEIVYSKNEILEKYASHAPFGSNVVGLQAACWRFFGIEPKQISWSQAATLAVLPNSPALIFPGKNQELLKKKRNQLLQKLFQHHYFDTTTYSLALQEPVPGPPKSIPQTTSELAVRLGNEGKGGQTVYTSLNATLQMQAEKVIERYHKIYEGNEIYNGAAMVVDISTGKVLAYVGNTNDTTEIHGGKVDIITANRSYGSILKPVLYMAAMDAGKICPQSLLPDYPINIGGFSPKNFYLDYDGVVPADQALIRSLNIPNVLLLQQYGTAHFLNTLQNLGLTTFNQSAQYYGLSLILGGGECNLWQLTGMYAALAKRLLQGNDSTFTLSFLKDNSISQTFHTQNFSPAAIWTAFNVMTELYRPGDDGHWQQFSSSQKIAWKTGTSFGNRDAWAIGITSHYAVGVWVGNASGYGRPGLTGATYAAPIMFDLFSLLPQNNWFEQPESGWKKVNICLESGAIANSDCPDVVRETIPSGCSKSSECSFHQIIHLDPSGKFQVNSSCMNPEDMISKSWFILTPPEALYFAPKHSNYRPLPPLRNDCQFNVGADSNPMTLVYPSNHAKIYIPKEREGNQGKVIFTVADRNPNATVYWHANSIYLGQTKGTHKMEVDLPRGKYHFTLVDNEGNELSFEVEFLQKRK